MPKYAQRLLEYRNSKYVRSLLEVTPGAADESIFASFSSMCMYQKVQLELRGLKTIPEIQSIVWIVGPSFKDGHGVLYGDSIMGTARAIASDLMNLMSRWLASHIDRSSYADCTPIATIPGHYTSHAP